MLNSHWFSGYHANNKYNTQIELSAYHWGYRVGLATASAWAFVVFWLVALIVILW